MILVQIDHQIIVIGNLKIASLSPDVTILLLLIESFNHWIIKLIEIRRHNHGPTPIDMIENGTFPSADRRLTSECSFDLEAASNRRP